MWGSGAPLDISNYDPEWPKRFREIATVLREVLGEEALRIDHIGSTSVPRLAAKALIDVQVTVEDLQVSDLWPEELLPGLIRLTGSGSDHVPRGLSADPTDWAKRFWSKPQQLNVHVREVDRPNQRYALLFRDFLRADVFAAASYEAVKRALAIAAPNDWKTYYAIKDPTCDLIIAGAERWAELVGWSPAPSDA